MLSFVLWKWRNPGYGHVFTAEHVNIMRNMIERHYSGEHEVVCFTDDPEGIDERVRVEPLPTDYLNVPNPMGEGFPSCFVRLFAFSDEMKKVVPNRFVSLDLDAVIVGDITELLDRDEELVWWYAKTKDEKQVNGSMWMHVPGTRTELWSEFNPAVSPFEAVEAGWRGSDQGWFSYKSRDEAGWTSEDGVYSWDPQLKRRGYFLPKGAKIIFFHGPVKPWSAEARKRGKFGWVKNHWK